MIANHIARKVGETVQKRIDHLGIGQKMQDLPEELWHESFRYYVKEDPNRRGGPNLRMIRLDPQKPSLTVTGFVFNKFVHPFENRFISVREAARLQGFPDDFSFWGSLTSTQQQVGNAVPVPLAKELFKRVLDFADDNSLITNGVLTGLSLFCGAGGLDLGAFYASDEQRKVDVKVAIDCWEDACNSLKGFQAIHTDVEKEDISSINDPIQYWAEHSGVRESPDIVFGGPPCQAFSQAGKQKALEDERGVLVFQFIRFIKELQPKFFIMENVANLQSVNKGKLYKEILDQMAKAGYNVTSGILCAADYGAPQLRRRMIFMGCRNDIGVLTLPYPTHSETPTLEGLPLFVTVADAFQGLPPLDAEESRIVCDDGGLQ